MALVGPNAAGKSTLVRTLAGLLPVTSGAVRLEGKPLAEWGRTALARAVALVTPEEGGPVLLSVQERVALGRYPHRGPFRPLTDADHEAVSLALHRTGIAHLAHRPLATLSSGERQLAALARSLAQQPRVLLLDEPAAHLDIGHQLQLFRILDEIRGGGRGGARGGPRPPARGGVGGADAAAGWRAARGGRRSGRGPRQRGLCPRLPRGHPRPRRAGSPPFGLQLRGDPMKIVSLLPAATEIVCALGLREQLVARSHECDFPAGVETLPALTRARVDSSLDSAAIDDQVREVVAARLPIYTLDESLLAALAPDVVVTQEACEVCAISYDQVVGALRRTSAGAEVVSLSPTRLDHIVEDVLRVARACGVEGRGVTVADDLRRRLEQAAARPLPKRPRVAVIEWLAPVMLAGHWVPDAIRAAGGIAVGPIPATLLRTARGKRCARSRPTPSIVAPCGFDLDRTIRESAPFRRPAARPRAAGLLLDGNAYLNRPGPRIVEAVETIAAWLRGEPVPAERGRGSRLQIRQRSRGRARFRGTNPAAGPSIPMSPNGFGRCCLTSARTVRNVHYRLAGRTKAQGQRQHREPDIKY